MAFKNERAIAVALFTRAWIEMKGILFVMPKRQVALFTRAWIEIFLLDGR